MSNRNAFEIKHLRYFVLNPPPFITGNDLKGRRLPPGPIYKQLLDAVREAQLDGSITTRAEAMALLERLIGEVEGSRRPLFGGRLGHLGVTSFRDKMRQKPVVYLLVIPPILFGGGLGLIVGLIFAYSELKGIPRSAVPDLNGLLISLPAFFLWIPASLLVSNIVLHQIPPLRRIAERYAAEAHRPGFAESQGLLLKWLFVFAVIFVPLIVLGFVA